MDENIPEDIQWICQALDLINPYNTEETLIQVLTIILEGTMP